MSLAVCLLVVAYTSMGFSKSSIYSWFLFTRCELCVASTSGFGEYVHETSLRCGCEQEGGNSAMISREGEDVVDILASTSMSGTLCEKVFFK